MSVVEGRCKTYREKLNAAIAEQQDLYTRSKELCERTIQDVQEVQQKSEASLESVQNDLKTVEKSRDQLRQTLKKSVALAETQVAESKW
jgi:hypothetical protein